MKPGETPEVELLDASSDDRETQSDGNVSLDHRGTSLLMLAAGLIGALVLVWALTRQPSGNTAEDAADDQSVLEESDGSETTEPAPTSTTARPPTTAPTTLAPGQYLLGEPTGLWLFYGGSDSLQRLDLDNGRLDVYGMRAYPVATVNNELVVQNQRSGALGWVSASDPGEQAEGWRDGRIAPDPLGIWSLQGDRWTLMGLPDNRVVERRDTTGVAYRDNRDLVGRPGVVVPSPLLVPTPSGVYRYDESGYGRVGDGQVIAHDGERALVETCGPQLDVCLLAWVEVATWEPLDLPVPGSGQSRFNDEQTTQERSIQFAEIVGDGRWLLMEGTAGERGLMSLDDNGLITLGQEFWWSFPGGLAVSPDGVWIALDGGNGEISLFNTSRQEPVFYDSFSAELGGTLLFVPQPN